MPRFPHRVGDEQRDLVSPGDGLQGRLNSVSIKGLSAGAEGPGAGDPVSELRPK